MSAKLPVRRACMVCGVVVVINPSRARRFKVCSKACWGKFISKKMRGNKYRVGKPASNGYATGHTPWNKNKKGIHLSPNSEFKEGQKAINHLPVGTLVIRIGKGGTKRRFIKVAEPNRWTEYAKWVWLNKGGRSISKGLLVHHINGNALDDRFSNLQLVTRSEHLKIHRPQWNAKRLERLSIVMKRRWAEWRIKHPIKAKKLAQKRTENSRVQGVLL